MLPGDSSKWRISKRPGNSRAGVQVLAKMARRIEGSNGDKIQVTERTETGKTAEVRRKFPSQGLIGGTVLLLKKSEVSPC